MRIEIEIPKEFEKHFNDDKFKDSFERIMADIKHSLQNGDCLCAGRYEHETMEMLENAFENSKPAYSIDKVVEELEKELNLADKEKERCTGENHLQFDSVKGYASGISSAIEIVKQGGVDVANDATTKNDDVCEWRIKDDYHWHTGCRNKIDNMDNEVNTIEDYIEHTRFNYCPFCRKKIKVVGNDNKS